MSTLDIWVMILGLGVITYAIRFSFLGLLAGRDLPPIFREALGYVPVTVLPALVAPMVLIEDGVLTAEPARITGALAGVVLGALLRHVLAAILGAMITYTVVSALTL
ncbi:MAG: AzlD domain-containing protein [Pseudomonadota bacterium]